MQPELNLSQQSPENDGSAHEQAARKIEFMSIDPYALCPCDSGKKLKFCCINVAEEMEKATQMVANENYRGALKFLEKVDKKHPNTPWTVLVYAYCLNVENDDETAFQLLKQAVSQNPDHPGLFTFFTRMHVRKMGYDMSRKLIERTIQLNLKNPELGNSMGLFYSDVAEVLDAESRPMAARNFLTHAIRFGDESSQQFLMKELYEIDSENKNPLYIRGSHPLKPWTTTDTASAERFRKVLQLCSYGLYQRAESMLLPIAEANLNEFALWWNLGLIRAWDCQNITASEALEKAGSIAGVPAADAIEALSLGYVLKWIEPFQGGQDQRKLYTAQSAARVLSQFDQNPNLQRTRMPNSDTDQDSNWYLVLERPYNSEIDHNTSTPEEYPIILGSVTLNALASDAENAVQVMLFSNLSDIKTLEEIIFQNGTSELLTALDLPQAEGESGESLPFHEDIKPLLRRRWYMDSKMPANRSRELFKTDLLNLAAESWQKIPLDTFGQKSFEQAKHDPATAFKCVALVYAIEATLGVGLLSPGELHHALGVQPLPSAPLVANTDIGQLSNFQLALIETHSLNLEQLKLIAEKFSISQDANRSYPVLEELVKHPDLSTRERCLILKRLADIQMRMGNNDTAINWYDQSLALLPQVEFPLEERLYLELEYLMLLTQAKRSNFKAKIEEFRSKYGPKVPQVNQILDRMLIAGGETPGGSSILMGNAPAQGSQLWTPDQPQPQVSASPSSGGGLWIPGQ
jgi:tetratricopeptide (TPR) repeat protein